MESIANPLSSLASFVWPSAFIMFKFRGPIEEIIVSDVQARLVELENQVKSETLPPELKGFHIGASGISGRRWTG